MNKFGFQIRILRITGKNLIPAEVAFAKGLNVVTGPSNTGKSFIFRCLEFMLAGQTKPKPIAESAGYDTVNLEIETTDDGKFYTLRRSLKGGETNLYNCRLDEITDNTEVYKELYERPKKGKESVSSFLMHLAHIKPFQIKKNDRNEKINSSFRTLSKLFMVDETKIQAEESLILTSNYTEKTFNKNQFFAFITGVDDSSLITQPKKEIVSAKIEAKDQLYGDLINRTQSAIDSIKNETEFPDVSVIELRTQELNKYVENISKQINTFLDEKRKLVNEKTEIETRILTVDQLGIRFKILQQHYESDLKRLDFLDEAEDLLEQLQITVCEHCGQRLKDSKHEHKKSEDTIAVKEACFAEAKKIRSQLRDLETTNSSLENERIDLIDEKNSLDSKIDSVQSRIERDLKPILTDEQSKLSYWTRIRQEWDRLGILQSTLETYITERAALKKEAKEPVSKKTEGQEIDYEQPKYDTINGALYKLSKEFSKVLEAWNHMDQADVSFEISEMDFIINGDSRTNSGKGIRALTYAAFLIALLRFCQENKKAHPGFLVMDSPLTTLKEAQFSSNVNAEEVPGYVQQSFFMNLAETTNFCQVIVMDNKEPSKQLKNINIIEFTRNSAIGRYGFFPTSES